MVKKYKKSFKIIICFLIILLIVFLVYFLVLKKESKDNTITKKLSIINDLNVNINTKINLLSFVKEDNEVEIISEDEEIDTSKLGKQKLEIKYNNGKEDEVYSFYISVVDLIPPIIEYNKEINVNKTEKIDLLKGVVVSDNSNEEIKAEVKGNYDINKVGTYNLEYVATDSSGNETVEKFTLKVNESLVYETKIYPKLSLPSGEKIDVGVSSNGFNIFEIDGSTYIDDILITNKSYPLGDDFVPSDTYTSAVGVSSLCNTCINKIAYNAWLDLKDAAGKLGHKLWLQSGYRPFSLQTTLYNRYVAKDGKTLADTYSSRPGYSEHQTGLSFDLNTITNSFANTNEGKWVNDNCYKYGYIIRFPKGKENYTGYQYEPWHIRYVGTELATKLYNNGNWLSLEEYFGIDSEYKE